MAERFLILGSTGMVGSAWARLLEQRGVPYTALSRSQLDLSDANAIESIPSEYDVIVNCAAYTQVDQAETEPDVADRINGEAPGWLAARANAIGARFVHYSTDYVFNGHATQPYPVNAPTDPVNRYGQSKLLGEIRVRDACPHHLLLRTSWVYAPHGKNFVLTIAGLLRSKPKLQIVDDQRGRPSSAEQLAKNSLALLNAGAQGTLHLTDQGECSWYEFALEIRNQLGLDTPIDPCTSEAFPRPAPRPRYSVLDLEPTLRLVPDILEWTTALEPVTRSLQTST